MRIVVALGGNALLERGERPEAGIQQHHVRQAAEALAPLTATHEVVLCHGNGPQVGLLAVQSGADPDLAHPYPLDTLGAQTQGMIGYWLAQALRGAGARRPVAALVTQTVVDPDDGAFAHPTKFIGPVYDEAQAARMAARHGWTVAPDGPGGQAWRRVVPSPRPVRIVELEQVAHLLRGGAAVICAGGGGIPVVEDGNGRLCGVDAVVDKDLTAALLAQRLDADRLVVLTDVPAVMSEFGTPRAAPIARLRVADLDESRFPAGSMGPKIAACRQFVGATGRPAVVGALGQAAAVLAGTAGTAIVP
ncbi:MAG: carbamate kinase [Jatrophihabitans sp.]|nr:MAG: carbamate kinase [Jatrophihabitans sp.]